jgi:Tfp pilus assembly protein PilO
MWLIGTAIVGFVLVLIGYFFFISPQRDQTSQVNDQIATAQTQNDVLQSRITSLNAQNAKLAVYQKELQTAELALPETSGMAAFLRTLQSIGASTSTTLSALSVGQPVAQTPVAPAVPAGSSSSSPSPSPTTTTTSAPPAGSGVYSIPIVATLAGSSSQLSAFLTQLQSVQPRAVLITQIVQGSSTPAATTTTKTGGGLTSLQLTMEAFVAPVGAAVAPSTAVPSPTAGA